MAPDPHQLHRAGGGVHLREPDQEGTIAKSNTHTGVAGLRPRPQRPSHRRPGILQSATCRCPARARLSHRGRRRDAMKLRQGDELVPRRVGQLGLHRRNHDQVGCDPIGRKSAVTAFDAAAARGLRRSGIRLIDVRPPHTETGLAERPIAGTAPSLPAGRDPDDVAAHRGGHPRPARARRVIRALIRHERAAHALSTARSATSSTSGRWSVRSAGDTTKVGIHDEGGDASPRGSGPRCPSRGQSGPSAGSRAVPGRGHVAADAAAIRWSMAPKMWP